MVEIMTKIKLRVLNFEYVVAINMTIMYIKSMGFVKSYGQTHLILLQMSWNLLYVLRVVG